MKTRLIAPLLVILPLLGAVRAAEPAKDDLGLTLTPTVRYLTVSGDEKSFRAHTWQREGWAGGVSELSLQRPLGNDWQVDLSGRAIFDQHDYAVRLEIINPAVGFLRAGFVQYRKYYDDSGGYHVFPVVGAQMIELDEDLYVDIGRFYVELGLTLPKWPQLVLGYERDYRDGHKSMIEWGTATGGGRSRGVFPALKDIDDVVDIYRVEIDHDFGRVHVGDQFRFEHYRMDAYRLDDSSYFFPNPLPTTTVTVREEYRHNALANTFHMDSHLNEKVYWSLGYLYSRLDGDPSTDVNTYTNLAGVLVKLNNDTAPLLRGTQKDWQTLTSELDQQSHVFNGNVFLGPFKYLSLYGGVQLEKTTTDADSDAELFEGSEPEEEGRLSSNNRTQLLEERLGVRFHGLPFTTVYAEGKWIQGRTRLNELELVQPEPESDWEVNFARKTDTDILGRDCRVGFSTSPCRGVTISSYYRYAKKHNDYDDDLDTTDGYSAFIKDQELATEEIGAKLAWRPMAKLALSLKYQRLSTDIRTRFDNNPNTAHTGDYDANIYTVSATITPLSRCYVTGLFSYTDTRTRANDNDSNLMITYRGNVYSAGGALGFALDNKTDLRVKYTLSLSDNFKDVSVVAQSYGMDYTQHELSATLSRQLTERVSASVGYGWYDYAEGHDGDANDYTAHLASVSCTIRF
jgi:hypothetical protein